MSNGEVKESSVQAWFCKMQNKRIEFRTPECSFLHRAVIVDAKSDHVELNIDGVVTVIPYAQLTMWRQA